MSRQDKPYPGVNWDKRAKRWRARIMRGDVQTALGMYLDRDEAIAAREEAERDMPTKILRKAWSEGELATLREMREAGRTFLEISKKIGRSAEVCRSRYTRITESYPRRPWTNADIARLRANATIPTAEIARLLQRSEASVVSKIIDLGEAKKRAKPVAKAAQTCRFPLALVPRKRLCGEPAGGGYCDFHSNLMQK